MALISENTLARLADLTQTLLLVDSCDILRETRTAQTATGGYSTTYPPVNTAPVPCAVVPAGNPTETILAGQEVGSAPVFILLPLDTDVRGPDRIRVTSARDGSVTTYHVIDLLLPETIAVVSKVLARRASLVG